MNIWHKIHKILSLLRTYSLTQSLYYTNKYHGHCRIGKAKIMGDGKICFHDNKSKLYLGTEFTIPQDAVVTLMRGSELHVCGKVRISRGCKIVLYPNAKLYIGNNSFINEQCRIHCASQISIGDQCAIGWNTNILDTDIHHIYDNDKCLNQDQPIIIGNNVWIGANCMVMKGTTIDNNCILSAKSTCYGHLDSNFIYGGSPLRRLKKFDYWSI